MSKVWTIFGTGAHARKAYHCVVQGGDTVAAFADENPQAQAPVAGVPVWSAAQLARAVPGNLFVAIGRADARQRLMEHGAAAGWRLPALVHPRASVALDAVLEDGVLVAAGAVVESAARVGRGSIVDIGVLVDHDVSIAAFSHLRPGQVCPAGSVWPLA